MQKSTETVISEKNRILDEQAVIAAVRELGGRVRFRTIMEKLGWNYLQDMRRLDQTLQRLRRANRLLLSNMRWSLPA